MRGPSSTLGAGAAADEEGTAAEADAGGAGDVAETAETDAEDAASGVGGAARAEPFPSQAAASRARAVVTWSVLRTR